jgi:hypothetical protein
VRQLLGAQFDLIDVAGTPSASSHWSPRIGSSGPAHVPEQTRHPPSHQDFGTAVHRVPEPTASHVGHRSDAVRKIAGPLTRSPSLGSASAHRIGIPAGVHTRYSFWAPVEAGVGGADRRGHRRRGRGWARRCHAGCRPARSSRASKNSRAAVSRTWWPAVERPTRYGRRAAHHASPAIGAMPGRLQVSALQGLASARLSLRHQQYARRHP